MTTPAELQTQLDALREARASGARRVLTQTNGVKKEIEFRTDAELAAAIADLERRLGGTAARVVYVKNSKGF